MLGMRAIWIVPVIASILILGILGLSQNAFSAIFIDAFDVSGQDTDPRSLAFNTDGTKMFVTGTVSDDVNEYACTTGFDVSTCSFTVKAGNPFLVSAQDTFPTGLAFNTDGTKMFVLGAAGDDVNEYACTTGFDVSTCAYSGDAERFDVSGQETNPSSLAFNTDGTKMFVTGIIGDDVNEYTLPIAFDVSSLPPDAIQDLIEDVEDLPLDNKDSTKLTGSLDKILKALDNEDTVTACDQLNKFIKDTQKLIDKGKLDATDGQALIDSANDVKDAIPC